MRLCVCVHSMSDKRSDLRVEGLLQVHFPMKDVKHAKKTCPAYKRNSEHVLQVNQTLPCSGRGLEAACRFQSQ